MQMEQSIFGRLFHLYLKTKTILVEQKYLNLENVDMFSPATRILEIVVD